MANHRYVLRRSWLGEGAIQGKTRFIRDAEQSIQRTLYELEQRTIPSLNGFVKSLQEQTDCGEGPIPSGLTKEDAL